MSVKRKWIFCGLGLLSIAGVYGYWHFSRDNPSFTSNTKNPIFDDAQAYGQDLLLARAFRSGGWKEVRVRHPDGSEEQLLKVEADSIRIDELGDSAMIACKKFGPTRSSPSVVSVYSSDGTKDGTRLAFTTNGSFSGHRIGKRILYDKGTLKDGFRVDLHVSDGTVDGSMPLTSELIPGQQLTLFYPFVEHKGLFYFGACPRGKSIMAPGKQLHFTTDGTTVGTKQLSETLPFQLPESRTRFHRIGNKTFFYATRTTKNAPEKMIWYTEGALEDATPLLTYETAIAPIHSNGSKLIFAQLLRGSKAELIASDGTEAGTKVLNRFERLKFRSSMFMNVDFNFSRNGSLDRLPGVVVGANFIFAVLKKDGPAELWKTDGTKENTELITQLENAANIGQFRAYADTAYFLVCSENDGKESVALWKSDGTEAGSTVVTDIRDTFGQLADQLEYVIWNDEPFFFGR